MKKNIFTVLAAIVIFAGCSNGIISCADNKNTTTEQNTNQPGQFNGQGGPGMQGGPGGFGGFGQSVEIIDDGSTTNYVDTTTATATGVVEDDLYENFAADGTVYINFDGTNVTANLENEDPITITDEEKSIGKISGKEVTVKLSHNTIEDAANGIDEASNGVIIQYNKKGEGKIKYVLTGTYTGTVFIKNKSADAAVVLNNVNITSDSGAGPVLRFSSEKRTFIVVPAGTTNT